MKTVIDTYAWIEIFIGSKSGEKAKETLQKAEETYTPDVVIAEIARKYLREGMTEQTIRERLTTIEETSEIIPIDKNIAFESAKCYLELMEKAKTRKLFNEKEYEYVLQELSRLPKELNYLIKFTNDNLTM